MFPNLKQIKITNLIHKCLFANYQQSLNTLKCLKAIFPLFFRGGGGGGGGRGGGIPSECQTASLVPDLA